MKGDFTMKGLGILAGIIALLCMAMGIVTLLGVLPQTMVEKLPAEFTWDVWFWLSALLFLANIACIAGGRGGGDEY